jgi:hypothetical protein
MIAFRERLNRISFSHTETVHLSNEINSALAAWIDLIGPGGINDYPTKAGAK